jgi:hypothetical protein
MIMMRTERYLLLIAVTALLISGWMFVTEASAQSKNPCSEDIARFCEKVSPGPAGMAALMDCLEKHEKELSDACRKFEAGIGGQRMERSESVGEKRRLRERCANDITKFCNDTTPTKGGMLKCLKEHEKELSDPCKDVIKSVR